MLKDGRLLSDRETVEHRLTTCHNCEFIKLNEGVTLFNTVKIIPEHYRCSVCTCIIKAKVLYKESACPKNKWTM